MTDDFFDYVVGPLLATVLIVAVAFVIGFTGYVIGKEDARHDSCTERGFARAKEINGKWTCISEVAEGAAQ